MTGSPEEMMPLDCGVEIPKRVFFAIYGAGRRKERERTFDVTLGGEDFTINMADPQMICNMLMGFDRHIQRLETANAALEQRARLAEQKLATAGIAKPRYRIKAGRAA